MIVFNMTRFFPPEKLEDVYDCCNKKCNNEHKLVDGFMIIERQDEQSVYYTFCCVKCLLICLPPEGDG